MPTKLVPRYVVCTLAIIAGFTTGLNAQASPSKSQTPSRIVSQIDDSARFTIVGSRPRPATPENDIGALDGAQKMSRMVLLLGASPDQEYQARTLLDSQQTKGSPDYHHWLTPDEFGQKFGPSAQDIQQVTGWLQQRGFSVDSIAKSGRWIEFSGTVAQVEAAFQTQMRQYLVAGETHVANATDISIPAALSPVVKGVLSLHNFFSKPRHSMGSMVHGVSDGSNPNATLHDSQGNVVHALAPGDFANIYNLGPLYTAGNNGSGQSIAIVARSDIDTGDIADFKSVFGLGNSTLSIFQNGPDPGDVPGDDVEATLDVEWSNAVATGATIDLVISSSTATTDGVDLSALYIVDNNLAPVMSVSFNLCEQLLGSSENAFINSLELQAAAQGISVFVSAGDDGAAACDDPNNSVATGPVSVGGLSSPPYVTAVGGTEFNETVNGGTDTTYWNAINSANVVSAKGYIPEMVWNESCSTALCGAGANLFAGSGGLSTIYATPSWQASTGIPGLNFSARALPDVSLAAAGGHDGYLFCFQRVCAGGNSFFIIGGTSASSPAFAGIMAIIDQKTGSQQGLANYVLYSLAKNETFANCNSSNRTAPGTPTACVFNDVTAGNNTVPGEAGFNATLGYDLATGLGSVNASNLANAWPGSFQGSQNTLSITSPALVAGTLQIVHGQPVSVNIAVQKAGGGAGPTGTVALVTNKPGPAPGSFLTVGAGALVSGAFTGTFDNLPGGTYTLTAHYPGDGTFGSSDSAAIPAVVSGEASTTKLTSIIGFTSAGVPITGTTVAYGAFLDLRTVVTSSANTSPPDAFPTGTITLTDGSTTIGSLTLNSEAQSEFINCSTPVPVFPPCLAVGSHPISVSYAGDGGFAASNSNVVTITITKGNPTVAIVAPATAAFNTPFTVTAQVQPTGIASPTGTVQFFQGSTALGSPVTLAPGNPSSASAQVTLSGTGNQTITAQYSGDNTYNGATSPIATINVVAPFNFSSPTRTQIVAAGGTATFNVSLNGAGGFTGTVNLACTGAPSPATCAVTPNPANLSSTVTSVPLTVTVSNTANARLTPAPFRILPFVFAGMIGAVLFGMRRKPRQRLLVLFAILATMALSSCGGGTPRGPTNATLTVTATSGGVSSTITLNLTITH